MGSGCGSVGRAVASDTRDLQLEFRHRQSFIYQLYNRKDENTGMAHLLTKVSKIVLKLFNHPKRAF